MSEPGSVFSSTLSSLLAQAGDGAEFFSCFSFRRILSRTHDPPSSELGGREGGDEGGREGEREYDTFGRVSCSVSGRSQARDGAGNPPLQWRDQSSIPEVTLLLPFLTPPLLTTS